MLPNVTWLVEYRALAQRCMGSSMDLLDLLCTSHFFPPVDFSDIPETLGVSPTALEMLLRDTSTFTP